MDLGMLSSGAAGRGRTAQLLVGLLVLFAVVAGLQYGAVAIAFAVPALLLTGKRTWAWSIVTGGIVSVLVAVLFNSFMHIIWPEPVVMNLIRNTFS